MPIINLSELKKNEVFIGLNRLQSQFDATEPSILGDRFSRSPLHAIQFLIAYAGLGEEQRRVVITQLNNELITKEQLDDLIKAIHWDAILRAPSDTSTLKFNFTIGLANPDHFLNAVKTRYPSLHRALTPDALVRIEQADNVVFTTKIAQDELWARKFEREPYGTFWNVPKFHISDRLKDLVDSLGDKESRIEGCFTITKGEGRAANTVELHIIPPIASNQFSIESKIEPKPGIYGAFIGLTDFYGLDHVDGVIVEVESRSDFSDKGASASQTQVVKCFQESYFGRSPEPTIITVNDLNVYFMGADIVATFSKSVEKTAGFDPSVYIELPTKSQENTHVALLAHTPKPRDTFALVQSGMQFHEPTYDEPAYHRAPEFFKQLRILSNKAEQLAKKGHSEAAAAAKRIHHNLYAAYMTYHDSDKRETDKIALRNTCTHVLDKNKKDRSILEKHRGWKQILGNLALAVVGLGIGYLIAGVINMLHSGRFLFFRTNSAQLIDEVENSLTFDK